MRFQPIYFFLKFLFLLPIFFVECVPTYAAILFDLFLIAVYRDILAFFLGLKAIKMIEAVLLYDASGLGSTGFACTMMTKTDPYKLRDRLYDVHVVPHEKFRSCVVKVLGDYYFKVLPKESLP